MADPGENRAGELAGRAAEESTQAVLTGRQSVFSRTLNDELVTRLHGGVRLLGRLFMAMADRAMLLAALGMKRARRAGTRALLAVAGSGRQRNRQVAGDQPRDQR